MKRRRVEIDAVAIGQRSLRAEDSTKLLQALGKASASPGSTSCASLTPNRAAWATSPSRRGHRFWLRQSLQVEARASGCEAACGQAGFPERGEHAVGRAVGGVDVLGLKQETAGKRPIGGATFLAEARNIVGELRVPGIAEARGVNRLRLRLGEHRGENLSCVAAAQTERPALRAEARCKGCEAAMQPPA